MEYYRSVNSPRKTHFFACRMLQFAFDGNSAELNQLIRQLDNSIFEHADIRLCIGIIEAINVDNLTFLIGLSKECPSDYVKVMVRMFLDRIRNSILLLLSVA